MLIFKMVIHSKWGRRRGKTENEEERDVGMKWGRRRKTEIQGEMKARMKWEREGFKYGYLVCIGLNRRQLLTHFFKFT